MKSVWVRAISQSAGAPHRMFGLWPPILLGLTLPVSRWRRTHLIALLTDTSNRAAAARAEIPSRSTANTNRARKSVEMGLTMPCWPAIPANSLKQKIRPKGIPFESIKYHPALGHDRDQRTSRVAISRRNIDTTPPIAEPSNGTTKMWAIP